MDSYSVLLLLGFGFGVIVLYLLLVRRRRKHKSAEFDAFMVMMLGLGLISLAAAACLHWLQGHTDSSQAPMAAAQFLAEHPVLVLATVIGVLLGTVVGFAMIRSTAPDSR